MYIHEQVKVSLINPPSPFVALDLEEAAQHLLSDLIGKDVGRIDLRLVHNLVHERIVKVKVSSLSYWFGAFSSTAR